MIAVVIPCFKVRKKILAVLAKIGPEVDKIFVVDDCCPEDTGQHVVSHARDARVSVIFHEQNQGVGGAVLTGYAAAMAAGASIAVKLDGDGQMDPALIRAFIAPLERFEADYTKGNRFYSLYNVRKMPGLRLFGNTALGFMTKISSGYWRIFDPTNGYTAVRISTLKYLEFKNISKRYFFETDMLINLGSIRAVVRDIPMEAMYDDEQSSLKISDVAGYFLWHHTKETVKRITYRYFLRDFNIGSLNLFVGLLLFSFGVTFGGWQWLKSAETGIFASNGAVMIGAVPIILGFQLLLSFINYDVSAEPTIPLSRLTAPDGSPGGVPVPEDALPAIVPHDAPGL
jgi:dolichol-phosphate mannosyltransferase